jgi:uncharacterized protein YjeT (DUF2065 family)
MNDLNQFVQRNPLSERHLRRLGLAGVVAGTFVPNDGLVAI